MLWPRVSGTVALPKPHWWYCCWEHGSGGRSPRNRQSWSWDMWKTAIVRLSLTKNLTWPCFQCAESAVLKAMSSQICDCIGQLPFAQGVLCNCTLHLANLGDCRAVGAFRTVLSPQTTWIRPPKQPDTKTKKQKVRIQYASSWTGQQQPMAAMAQRPALSNLKSVMSHDQPFDIGSLSSIPSVDMKVSTYSRSLQFASIMGAAEVVLRKMPRKMPRRP